MDFLFLPLHSHLRSHIITLSKTVRSSAGRFFHRAVLLYAEPAVRVRSSIRGKRWCTQNVVHSKAGKAAGDGEEYAADAIFDLWMTRDVRAGREDDKAGIQR